MRVRWRHERGDIGPSSSALVLLVFGISMLAGLRVSAPVDTDDAAMLGVWVVKISCYRPAVVASVVERAMCMCTVTYEIG